MEQSSFVEPMKPHTSSLEFLVQVDDDVNWAAAEKLDGFRVQLHLGATENHLYSSLGNDFITKCPQFQVVVPELAGTVLDGEGLSPTRMLEDNAACFKADAVNAIAYQKAHGWAEIVLFDLLMWVGDEVWPLPFSDRREALREVFGVLKDKMLMRLEVLMLDHKRAYWESIVKRAVSEGHEGVILKRMDAPYMPGKRSGAWLKVKREEVLVGTIAGYIGGVGKFQGLVGSLYFVCEGGIAGYTSGMDDSTREDMTRNFETKYKGRKCYIKCQEVTRLGSLRHPRYEGLIEGGNNESKS